MHRRTCTDTDQHIYQHTPHNTPRIAHNDGKPSNERRALFGPNFRFRIGLRLQLPHPRRKIALQLEAAEYEAADHAEQNAAHDINRRRPHAERTKEHRHSNLIHKRRGNQKRKCHTQRNPALDKTDEQRDRRAGAKRRDSPEQRCKKVLKPVQFAGRKVMAQIVNRKIGIDDSHYHTDQKQQDQNFDTVVEKEIDSTSEMCFGTHPEYAVDKPVGKSLNHRFNRNKLLHNKCPRL